MRYFRQVTAVLILFLLTAPLYAQDYSTPQSIFESFKEAAKRNDVQAYIYCTTQDSQKMLSRKMPNAGQLNAEYRDLADKQYRVEEKGDIAVLYLVPESPYNPPYYLVRERGNWKVDLKYMSEHIYFDQSNRWHWRQEDTRGGY